MQRKTQSLVALLAVLALVVSVALAYRWKRTAQRQPDAAHVPSQQVQRGCPVQRPVREPSSEPLVEYRGERVTRGERDRRMIAELREKGELTSEARIVVIGGRTHRFKRNEAFVSPYDVEGLRRVYKGQPPVFEAIRDRDLDRVYEFVSKNQQIVGQRNRWRQTPLHAAAYMGDLDIVKLLVDCGADVNAKDNRAGLPVFSAANFGHDEVVKYLIEKGTDVRRRDKHGFSALDAPRRFGLSSTVRILEEAGAE